MVMMSDIQDTFPQMWIGVAQNSAHEFV